MFNGRLYVRRVETDGLVQSSLNLLSRDILGEVWVRFDQGRKTPETVVAVRGSEHLNRVSSGRINNQPPHFFHDRPVQARVDLVDQQDAFCGLYERKREGEKTPHAVPIAAERHPATASMKSQQSTGSAGSCPRRVTCQKVDGLKIVLKDLHGSDDFGFTPFCQHLVPHLSHGVEIERFRCDELNGGRPRSSLGPRSPKSEVPRRQGATFRYGKCGHLERVPLHPKDKREGLVYIVVIEERGLVLEIGQMDLNGDMSVFVTRKAKTRSWLKAMTVETMGDIGASLLVSLAGLIYLSPTICRTYENEWIPLRYQEMYGFQD